MIRHQIIRMATSARISHLKIHRSVFATCSQIAAGLFTLCTAEARRHGTRRKRETWSELCDNSRRLMDAHMSAVSGKFTSARWPCHSVDIQASALLQSLAGRVFATKAWRTYPPAPSGFLSQNQASK